MVDEKIVESSLKGVNHIFFGLGYRAGIPVGVFGIPHSGKTIFCIQEAMKIASQIKKSILWVDTEGGADVDIELWMPVLAKQLGFTQKFYVKRITNMRDMIGFHGKNVDFQISAKETVKGDTVKKTAHVETLFMGDCEAEIESYFGAKNVGVVVYDSLTRMLHQFTSAKYIFGARSDAINLWMSQMFVIAEKYGLYVLGTHHASKDPTDEYANPTFVGGKGIGHSFKVLLYLRQREWTPQRTVREIILARFFNKEEWVHRAYARITDNGYVDMSKEEVALLAGELKKAKDKKYQEEKEKLKQAKEQAKVAGQLKGDGESAKAGESNDKQA